jgi:hypothetical protein
MRGKIEEIGNWDSRIHLKASKKGEREGGTRDNMNNNNNNNNSKEETGRDTPQLYSAIVGGEGQDFVATTLSTSAQVRRETERDHFFFSQRHHSTFAFQSVCKFLFSIFVSLSSMRCERD